jgi:hypothetical protein
MLKKGEIYTTESGAAYKCLSDIQKGSYYKLERISDRWTIYAYNVRMTEDGKIYWAYSGGGWWNRRKNDE